MKRVPEFASEKQIVHLTTDTGDLQRFVLSAENFDLEVITAMARMETEPIQGYRLAHVRTGESRLEFAVVRDADGVWLSHNVVHLDHWPPSLELETTILRPIPGRRSGNLSRLGAACGDRPGGDRNPRLV